MQNTTCVYTDGMCKSNGKKNSIGGYGIFFGINDKRNVSKKLDGYVTNNIAELSAMIHAIELVADYNTEVDIYTDSRYVLLACTTYAKKCFMNNWKNPNDKKKPIPNLELIKKTYYLISKYTHINFKYIKAHTGLQDVHSVGNEKADELANLSIFT